MSNDSPELLCRVNFPLYQVMMVSPRHVLVGGGGGAANTGVYNGFVSWWSFSVHFKALLILIAFLQEIFEISHNGDHCIAESVKRFSTDEFAVMNCAPSAYNATHQKTIIAVGLNEKCQLYSCQLARELVSPPDQGISFSRWLANLENIIWCDYIFRE